MCFFNAIKKYGWENIKHEILLENLTKEEAETKEIELIALYKSNQNKYGYNIEIGGNVNKGQILSEETRKKMSIARSGVPRSEEVKKKISDSKKGNQHPMYGKHLSNEWKEKISKAKQGRVVTEETRRKLSVANKGKNKDRIGKNNSQSIPVYQCDLEGNIIREWESIGLAAKALKFATTNISKCCNGKRKTAYGYTWKRVNN
jgi:group I intron endonuclease